MRTDCIQNGRERMGISPQGLQARFKVTEGSFRERRNQRGFRWSLCRDGTSERRHVSVGCLLEGPDRDFWAFTQLHWSGGVLPTL